jgi:hypothetical protein
MNAVAKKVSGNRSVATIWTFDPNTNTIRDTDNAPVASVRYVEDGERIVSLIADRAALVVALEASTTALENWKAYAVKHAAALPPVSLSSTEVLIERNRATLAKVQS